MFTRRSKRRNPARHRLGWARHWDLLLTLALLALAGWALSRGDLGATATALAGSGLMARR